MIDLPQDFTVRMQILLGDEYPSFLKSYEEPRRYGLRVNTLKISTEEFQRIAPFHLKPIPWIENGFFYEKEDAASRHPFYYAGLYYLQEPSAMTPAQVLPVTPGEHVLDLCAAPGGKATALAAKLEGHGLLVANDISASRAKALLKNLEVFGAVNTFVTNTTPAVLARQYPEAFDKILVDAPCSGEGMFRKDIANAKAWSLSKVKDCAKVQKEIILQAASMLRPGGKMLYSTCTFSPEENEQVIAYLLESCPEMEVLPIPMAEGFESGRPELAMEDWEKHIERHTENRTVTAELTKCVRIFPHKMPGEGHFLALLGKRERGAGGAASESVSPGLNRQRPGNWPERRLREGEEAEPEVSSGKVSGKNGRADSRMGEGLKEKVGENTRAEVRTRKTKEGKTRERRVRAGKNGIQIKTESKTAAMAEENLVEEFLHAILTGNVEKDRSLQQMESDNSHAVGEYGAESEPGFADGRGWQDIRNKIEIHGSQAYYVPAAPDVSGGIPFLRCGLYLGEIKKDRFEPSQALAMALRPESCSVVLDFDCADERVFRYLRGETVEVGGWPETHIGTKTAPGNQTAESGSRSGVHTDNPGNSGEQIGMRSDGSSFGRDQKRTDQGTASTGWRLVCVNGYPLGWGKLSGGTLKNKYHPGWRIRL